MNNHKFVLQPYKGQSTRYTCPECDKAKEFTRYIDIETSELLPSHVGKCNRIDKCGYHYTPKQYFEYNGIKPERTDVFATVTQPRPLPTSYIDDKTFNKSLQGYENNNLVNHLDTLFKPDIVDHLINIYKIGTSSRYGGDTTVFWQIDASDNVRTGKLIKYDRTGHRVKGCNNWVHSVIGLRVFILKQCFFGEHIIKYAPNATIGIVESEKTAIILQAQIPNLIWLASGGADGINKEKLKALRGRTVILFPDASKDGRIYKKWKIKAEQFGLEISDYLERFANNDQKTNGIDIADLL